MEISQKFALLISDLSKKKEALYVGDLAWTLGREEYIQGLRRSSEKDKLKLVNEYISNRHYLIKSSLKDKSKYINSIQKDKKFDYIFIDIHCHQGSYFHDSRHVNHFEVEHLDLLSKKGFALVVANEDEFSNGKSKGVLQDNGYYINAIFGLPLLSTRQKRLLKDKSIFFITRQKTSTLFVADLSKHHSDDYSGWKKIVANFFSHKSGADLSQGLNIKKDDFYTFNTLRSIERVGELSSYYDEYIEQEIGEILVSIEESIDAVDDFKKTRNGVFIIKNILNAKDLVTATTDKDYVENCNSWPYYYAVLNNSVLADYAAIFLQSHLGSSLVQGITNIVNHSGNLTTESIKEIPIFFPPIAVQKKIIRANNKIVELQESINQFRNNLSLNPGKFINESIDKIDDMLDQVGKLNKTDKVRQMIERGESATVEFKQTYGLETNPKHPKYEKSTDILKERVFEQMSAFLNSYGGVLLIGVHDEQYVTGMEKELSVSYGKSHDKFKLKFIEKISEYLGKEFASPDHIEYDFIPIDNHEIFQIKCNRSLIPCRFGKEERLVVQEDPRIRTLKGEDEMRYISKHFPEYFASHLT